MSLSINISSHSRHYFTQSASSQASTQTDTAYETSNARRRELERPKPEDSTGAFQLSPDMLRYLAGLDSEDATDTDTTYSASINSSMLTADQKKSMLSDLQTDLSSLNVSSTERSDSPPGLEELLSSIQDKLADFDVSNASDDEISALFDEVMGTIDQSRPPLPPPPDELGGDIPPMLRAMGGITPPFMLDAAGTTGETDGREESSTSSSLSLTTDQKKEWLSQLQSTLQALSEAAASSSDDADPTAELRALLQSRLNGYNADSTSDSEVSALYSSIAEII